MFHARSTIGVALAAGLLAGCEAADATRVAGAPDVLNVVSVNVTATPETKVTGRNFTRSPAGIVADVEAAVTSVLEERSNASGTPVEVDIALGPVDLANVAGRAVAQASSVTAVVSVTTLDGARVLPAQEIVSTVSGLRIPGAVGIVTTPSPTQDYSGTIDGFALTIGNAIFPEA